MNYKLYTHNDLDGVGCAILAKLAWGDGVEIRYCSSPDEVTNRLIKDDNVHRDLVYVTDCSFNYEKLRNSNHKVIGKIRLFDHHATALPLAEKSEYFKVQTHREDGKQTCGTEIFYQFLKERKGFTLNCDYFAEQVRLYDTWDWTLGTSDIPKYLSMLLFTDSLDKFCANFVSKLLKGNMNDLNVFTNSERAILEYEERRQQKELEKNLKNTYIVETNKYTYGIVFGNVNMSILGNAICEEYDVDIAMNINPANSAVGVRTTRNNLDLGKIMKDIYGGGGHPKAAGAPVNNLAEDIIRNIIRDRVIYIEKVG